MILRTVGSISVNRETADLRNRVYGLRSPFSPEIGILPDYTASVETVFEDAGYRIMNRSDSLDMLFLHGSGKDEIEIMPT